jgi:hypothetical protein
VPPNNASFQTGSRISSQKRTQNRRRSKLTSILMKGILPHVLGSSRKFLKLVLTGIVPCCLPSARGNLLTRPRFEANMTFSVTSRWSACQL